MQCNAVNSLMPVQYTGRAPLQSAHGLASRWCICLGDGPGYSRPGVLGWLYLMVYTCMATYIIVNSTRSHL